MRTSQYLLSTLKETPANAEVTSHQLMLRAGMIRKLASGLYTWLPTGLRVLKKIENIVREEMNNTGAIEIAMPVVQPANLWQESGRWKYYGSELFRFIDRSGCSFVLGPTHEEIITSLVRNELKSYKQLPINFFQIQTKFRDELRPCFGVIRSREFLMKDAYSFHISQESLQETYNEMYNVYNKIFTRMGLDFRIVKADTDLIGGNVSHEFQVLVQSKKNNIIFSNNHSYINDDLELINVLNLPHNITNRNNTKLIDNVIDTEVINIMAKQLDLYQINKSAEILTTEIIRNNKYQLVTLLIHNNYEFDKSKIERFLKIKKFINYNKIKNNTILNTNSNFFALINMLIAVMTDYTDTMISNYFVNKNNIKCHFGNIWKCNTGIKGTKNIIINDSTYSYDNISVNKSSIEVGHIFQLGTEYSKKINAVVQNRSGRNQYIIMGCYGIGLTRLVAAAIEQNHDRYGIIWPDNIAPFQVAIIPMNMYKSLCVRRLAEKIYIGLRTHNIEVLMDDRKKNLGMMITDIELIGIPHAVIISDHNLNNNEVEYKCRRSGKKQLIKINEIVSFLLNILEKNNNYYI